MWLKKKNFEKVLSHEQYLNKLRNVYLAFVTLCIGSKVSMETI